MYYLYYLYYVVVANNNNNNHIILSTMCVSDLLLYCRLQSSISDCPVCSLLSLCSCFFISDYFFSLHFMLCVCVSLLLLNLHFLIFFSLYLFLLMVISWYPTEWKNIKCLKKYEKIVVRENKIKFKKMKPEEIPL